MIRANVQSRSHSRDDALKYLYDKLRLADWAGWKRHSDILLTETRTIGGICWTAKTVMVREEDLR